MSEIKKVVTTLKQGGVIAYPTEGVYGLGCDPRNETALQRILEIKGRNANKGFILIAATWEQLKPFVEKIPHDALQTVLKTWPGAVTWIFPAKPCVSKIITGNHSSIAVRVSAHPLVQKICKEFGAMVSTSANRSGEAPAQTADEVRAIFSDENITILDGAVGGLKKPTPIFDALTGACIRQ